MLADNLQVYFAPERVGFLEGGGDRISAQAKCFREVTEGEF